MRTIRSLDLDGRRALVRVDFNVRLDRGAVADDARIRAALPTLRYALERGASCVLMAHLGRPHGKPDGHLELDPVARRLSELLPERYLRKCDEVVGPRARAMAEDLRPGQLLLLENLRFHRGEEANDEGFAAELAALGDLYVDDAFAACHREHASIVGAPARFAADARGGGLLLEREVDALSSVRDAPEAPFVAVFGGAKVEDKLEAVGALLDGADRVLVGGAMAMTFLAARGRAVGRPKVERDLLDTARGILDRGGDKILLPVDHAVAGDEGEGRRRTIARGDVPSEATALDIGPETIARYEAEIERARTVVWNGPMGKFEDESFRTGTRAVVDALARPGKTTVVGRGETGEAVRLLGKAEAMTHVSTGGGAFLTFLANGTLPGIEALEEARGEDVCC